MTDHPSDRSAWTELTTLAETWSRPVVFTRIGIPGVQAPRPDPSDDGGDDDDAPIRFTGWDISFGA